MKHLYQGTLLAILAVLLLMGSCRKEAICEDCRVLSRPPFANAGANQLVALSTDSIILDGTASKDQDGTLSSFVWRKISGPGDVRITERTKETVFVTNFSEGAYQFELTVTDQQGLTGKDTTAVLVQDLKELIFKDLHWDCSYGCETTIQDIHLYFPVGSSIRVFVKLEQYSYWLEALPDSHFGFGYSILPSGILFLWGREGSSTAQVKIFY